MSKNVSVKEGNIARKFRPVDRLNVVTDNEQGMWKPESAFKLGTLHVSENGIYIASLNGYAAYSEIDVRVTDKLGSDDPDSYDYITPDPENYPDVWEPDTGDWDETELNDPDEWELPEEFNEDSLDTGDLEEPEFDPYDPEASLDDFDPSDLDVSNIKLEDPKLPKETKIKGIDPDTGKEVEVTGIENEDGDMELSTEILPSAIHIVVPPRKRKYKEGDFIDYSGIHVYLLDDRHRRFTTEQYPTGEIPFGELIFPVTVAEGGGNTKTAEIDGVGSIRYLETSYFYIADSLGRPEYDIYYTTSKTVKAFAYNGYCYTYAEGEFIFYRSYPNQSPHYSVASKLAGTTSVSHKEIHLVTLGDYSAWWDSMASPLPPQSDTSKLTTQQIIDILFDGIITDEGNNIIPVQWMRSDGEILEDTFEIEIGSGGEPSPEPEPDPWAGAADVSWGGHHYNFNRRLVPPVQYANGYCWRQAAGEYYVEYTVAQASSMGWLILIR